MNVATILKRKGRAVTTAKPDMTPMEVTNKLADKRIGAIVIVGVEGELAGIISERDVIRALSAAGPECLTQPVSQSMTKHVVTCQETDTLDEGSVICRCWPTMRSSASYLSATLLSIEWPKLSRRR
jgi:CBS domain-containing protein